MPTMIPPTESDICGTGATPTKANARESFRAWIKAYLNLFGSTGTIADSRNVLIPTAQTGLLDTLASNPAPTGDLSPFGTTVGGKKAMHIQGIGWVEVGYAPTPTNSIAQTTQFPDATFTAYGQTINNQVVISNPSTQPIRGIVTSNWNVSFAEGAPQGLNVSQGVFIDGTVVPEVSSILQGGTTGGYDVNHSNTAGSALSYGGSTDASFGASMFPITIPAVGSVTVLVRVRTASLSGVPWNSPVVLQSRQIAFIGVSI